VNPIPTMFLSTPVGIGGRFSHVCRSRLSAIHWFNELMGSPPFIEIVVISLASRFIFISSAMRIWRFPEALEPDFPTACASFWRMIPFNTIVIGMSLDNRLECGWRIATMAEAASNGPTSASAGMLIVGMASAGKFWTATVRAAQINVCARPPLRNCAIEVASAVERLSLFWNGNQRRPRQQDGVVQLAAGEDNVEIRHLTHAGDLTTIRPA